MRPFDMTALVIGAGPAGLMAAQELALAGHKVTVADAMPSVGRKLLMAGRSGLNLTKAEEFELFLTRYGSSAEKLRPALAEFDQNEVQNWAGMLGQDVFEGTSGRVFPKAMKASPLLRAWIGNLGSIRVAFQTKWQWTGWTNDNLTFRTPEGSKEISPAITVFALGGASWSRLGSNGQWVDIFQDHGIKISPFAAANAGIAVNWSAHMNKLFGSPVKNVAVKAGDLRSRGEFVLSSKGLEGGGIYTLSPAIRDGADLIIDLLPGKTVEEIATKLRNPRGKNTITNYLRKTLQLTPAKIALLMEFSRPLPTGLALAGAIKSVNIKYEGLRPIDEAISVAGGVSWDAVDETLMLRQRPGFFVAGEMLDWEAPTGGYLLNACLATGKWAGKHAAKWG